MAVIPLTQGKETIVDDDDYAFLVRYKWHYIPPPKGVQGSGYAACGAHKTTRYLHRVIMLTPPKGLDVDHINGDGLDNRRENLRVVTHQKNVTDRHRLHAQNKSGHSGVFFDKATGGWRAYIDRGKRIYLGRHATREDAMRARQEAERSL